MATVVPRALSQTRLQDCCLLPEQRLLLPSERSRALLRYCCLSLEQRLLLLPSEQPSQALLRHRRLTVLEQRLKAAVSKERLTPLCRE